MRHKKQQRGVIFLALALILLVGGSAFTLSALNNRQRAELTQERAIYEEMELAREALIAYARYASDYYSNASPGLLPCPDRNSDGVADANCNPATEYFGRLPAYVALPDAPNGDPQRFYISSTYAGTDRQFWYAVSPNFLDTATGTLSANSIQTASLTVAGETDIMAVIIAPGEPTGLQDRTANPDDYAQYLEGGNGVNQTFVTSYTANPTAFNDSLLVIRRSDVRDANVYRAAASSIQERLNVYYTTCGYYPRQYRTTGCGFSFSSSYNSDPKAFLNWLHASGTVTWMQETAYGGDNWADTAAMTYDYLSSGTFTLDFKQPNVSSCIRFTLVYPSSITRTTPDPSC